MAISYVPGGDLVHPAGGPRAPTEPNGGRERRCAKSGRLAWGSFVPVQLKRPLAEGGAIHLHARVSLGPPVKRDGDLEPRQDRSQGALEGLWLLGTADRPHEGDRASPELRVGDGHHHGLFDALEHRENLLYLLGLDVLPAGDEEVVLAAQDAQVAALVQLAEVAGVEPAVRV